MEKIVEKGNKIKVHYTGTLEDGTKFDSSEGREPLEFKVGEKMVIKGFDDCVVGMKVGEEKEIHIKCDEAYGQAKPEMVQKLPIAALGEFKAEIGQMLAFKGPQGQIIQAKVEAIDKESVSLDLNHPLSGKNLNFKIKVVEIN